MTGYTKRRGDRFDARWLRDIDSMHAFMPYTHPNRTDNEAFLSLTIDLTALNEYLAAKNAENPAHRYTLFHVIVAAIARTIAMRPKMNRFMKGFRTYQRDKVTMSFVVKKQFSDEAHEALAFLEFLPEDTMDDVHERSMDEIHACRGDAPDNSTATMDKLTKFPRWVLRIVMKILNFLDFHGWVPRSIIKTDPYHATVFLSNLGSIGLKAGYHHLANWATNSIFVTLGEKRKRTFYDDAGQAYSSEVLDIGITLDERIADGYYYSGTIKLIEQLLQMPELLDKPAKESTP